MTTDLTTTPAAAEDASVNEAATDAHNLVTVARTIDVHNTGQAQAATAFLADIAAAKKRNEEARKFLVKPLNDHVKVINERFKQTAAPLDEADKLVRGKVIAFNQEQEAQRRAEQERLDAERRERERLAEEERQRAIAEAAEKARAAEEAEAERQRQLAEQADERRRAIVNMDDDALQKLAIDGDTLAGEELDARRNAREAQEAAAAAEQAAEEARVAALQAQSAPSVEVAAPAKLDQVASTKRWDATVIDETLVPREYLSVDMKKIRTAVREGVREIPGVKIEQVDGLAVRSAS